MAGELSRDEQYIAEFQSLIEERSEVVYENQDPSILLYVSLADMVVMCSRLYIALRAIEDDFDERMEKYIEEREASE